MQANLILLIGSLGLLIVGMLLAFYKSCLQFDKRMKQLRKFINSGKRERTINLTWYCQKWPVYNLPTPAIIEQVRKSTMLEF